MRRPHLGEGAMKPEARYHPEGAATRLTLGDLPPCLGLPAPQGVGMGRQKSAEVEVAGPTGEGLNLSEKLDQFSDRLEQMPRKRAQAGGSGRKPRDNAGRFIG